MTRPPYEYALSITSQFFFCGVPFRWDAAPHCTAGCLYCFSALRGGKRAAARLIASPESFERKIQRALTVDDSEASDVNAAFLSHRVPLHLGGVSDPFSNEATTSVSVRVLKAASNSQYPIIVSTKNTSNLVKAVGLLKENQNAVVQISISTSDERLAKVIEPKAPAPSERIGTLEALSNAGIYTMVRIQPLLLPWLEDIARDLIPSVGSRGCNHVILEFLKLPIEHHRPGVNRMLSAICWDAYGAYRENGATRVGREWVLPAHAMRPRLEPIIRAIHSHKMTYGAADYGLTHLGDTDCCCGIDTIAGFKGWFKGNFSNVIRNSPTRRLTFDQVRQCWIPAHSIRRYINSHSRLEGISILDYLRDKWNRPGTANSPDSFLGVTWSGERDEQGDCIYIRHSQVLSK